MEAALVKKYEDILSRDPQSRVFAQLGELYRKMGMHDRAMLVYRDGVKRHPSYALGYLGLAFCYYDLNQFQLAYATLRPLVESSRDNLRLQKLFARCCEALDYQDEALETWKYLLFINPKDSEVAAKVTALESRESSEHSQIETTKPSSFKLDRINPNPNDDVDDWIRVDLAKQEVAQEVEEVTQVPEKAISMDDLDANEEVAKNDEAPIVSLTLVDLYVAQGHIAKAQELLVKMLELNPSDERIRERIDQLKLSDKEVESEEEDGHSKLLKLVEEKQNSLAPSESDQTVQRLDTFLQNLKRKAHEKSSHT